LAAQPAALAIAVSFTDSVKAHLAFWRVDYSGIAAVPPKLGPRLAADRGTCSYLPMPWDFYLIFLVLGVLLPWRGYHRLRKLLAVPDVSSGERIALYLSTILFQWTAAGATAWRAFARGLSLEEIGLAPFRWVSLLLWALLGGALLGLLHWLNLRRMGGVDSERKSHLRAISERILPQSKRELIPYLALAVTAGICEEFLYRGFAMGALFRAGLPVWLVILLSSVLFGMAHLYQGRSGFLGTSILGLIFASARIAYHSVAPVMVWHAVVDVVAGIAGPRYLLRGKPYGLAIGVINIRIN